MRFLKSGIAGLLLLSLIGSGCATLKRVGSNLKATYCSTGLQCATTILDDFRWGVDAAASSDPEIAKDQPNVDLLINSALSAVSTHPTDWRDIVSKVLSYIQSNVQTPTTWVPYTTAALAVLPLIPVTLDEMEPAVVPAPVQQ